MPHLVPGLLTPQTIQYITELEQRLRRLEGTSVAGGQASVMAMADGRRVTVPNRDEVEIWIRNDTGSTVPKYGIYEFSDPLPEPDDDAAMFLARPAFLGITPTADQVRFAVGLSSAAPGDLIRAVASGITIANVNVADVHHAYAHTSEDDHEALVSSTTGAARILWTETDATGEQLAVIQFPGDSCCERCGDVAGSPMAYYLSWPHLANYFGATERGEVVRYIRLVCGDSAYLDDADEPDHNIIGASPLYVSQQQLGPGVLYGNIFMLGFVPNDVSEGQGRWHCYIRPFEAFDTTPVAKWISNTLPNGLRFQPQDYGGHVVLEKTEGESNWPEEIGFTPDQDGRRGAFLRDITVGPGLVRSEAANGFGIGAGGEGDSGSGLPHIETELGNQPHTLHIRLNPSGGAITGGMLAANSVGATHIIDGQVGTSELAASAVTSAKLAANSVGAGHIVDGQIGTAELADLGVTAGKIAAGAALKSGDKLRGRQTW